MVPPIESVHRAIACCCLGVGSGPRAAKEFTLPSVKHPTDGEQYALPNRASLDPHLDWLFGQSRDLLTVTHFFGAHTRTDDAARGAPFDRCTGRFRPSASRYDFETEEPSSSADPAAEPGPAMVMLTEFAPRAAR